MAETNTPTPELIRSVPERPAEHRETRLETPAPGGESELSRDAAAPAPVTPIVPIRPVPVPFAPTRDTVRQQVEAVLSIGLEETFAGLDPATQAAFKRAGEETATKIETLLQSTKIHVKKIVDLIVAWLKIIPGINVFFLEQEAKIKADKIMALRHPADQP